MLKVENAVKNGIYGKILVEDDKAYAIVINDQETLIMSNVETIKFDGGNLNLYNATGDLIGHFRRDHYNYFYKIGL